MITVRVDRDELRDANPGWRFAYAEGYAAGTEDARANRVVGPRWHRADDYGDGYRAAMRLHGQKILRAIAEQSNA